MVFGLPSTTKLQNDIFCLTEERDFFQAKFLEQVSEIANLKEELRKSKKEITRLRHELMGQSHANCSVSMTASSPPRSPVSRLVDAGEFQPAKQQRQRPKEQEEEKKDDDASSLTNEDIHRGAEDDEDDDDGESVASMASSRDGADQDSVQEIRQSAEKLLQWASYRSSMRTSGTSTTPTMPRSPDHSTSKIASGPASVPAVVAGTADEEPSSLLPHFPDAIDIYADGEKDGDEHHQPLQADVY